MTEYTLGQVVKGRTPPETCPEGFYWRKLMGEDAFKLYLRKERKATIGDGETEGPRITINRVAEGVRYYMQHEEGFKRVVETANLSVKALQNLAAWSQTAAVAKTERDKLRMAALAKANAALRDAGLTIGPDGSIRPITPD